MNREEIEATILRGGVIEGIDLSGAELDDAVLRGGIFESVVFDGASLKNAKTSSRGRGIHCSRSKM